MSPMVTNAMVRNIYKVFSSTLLSFKTIRSQTVLGILFLDYPASLYTKSARYTVLQRSIRQDFRSAMKHSAAWLLFLSACCRAIPLDSREQCGVTLDQEPSCKNGVLEGFDNSSPITTSSCPISLSVDIKGATYSLVAEVNEDPREPGYLRESTVTRFDNKIAPQEIKLEDSVFSFQTDFKGEEYRYVLNAQRDLFDNYVLSFYTGRRGHFEGKIGYKCIDGVAKAILLPPDNCEWLFYSCPGLCVES